MNNFLGFLIFILFLYKFVIGTEVDTPEDQKRDPKLFPVFQVIRFRNEPCAGGSKNGTCYTAAECTTRSGTNGGSCANGFGVCCTFTGRCGTRSSENCTYFESVGNEQNSCTVSICKCDSDVTQLRLDFQAFMVTGPSTSTVTIGKTSFGVLNAKGGVEVATSTQCDVDTFSVTNPGGDSPPVICGMNTGEHMYVGSSDSCNDLVFQFRPAPPGAAAANRQWSIKVIQIRQGDVNMAPPGCTQYFTEMTGVIRSYNFQGGTHLADQDQNICIRRERGMCRICYAAADVMDILLSGMDAKGFTKGSVCCGYGEAGDATSGYDCVIIPGAEKKTGMVIPGNEFCGRSVGLVDMTMGADATVCSRQIPFGIRFVSDTYEFMKEAAKMMNKGFQLSYVQDNCG